MSQVSQVSTQLHPAPQSYRSLDNGHTDRFDFADFWSFQQECRDRPIFAESEDRSATADFYGTTDFESADRLAIDGVPALEREIIQQRGQDLAAMGCFVDVPVRFLDVSGEEPCIDAYLRGEPECMWNPGIERREGSRILRVLCTYGGKAFVTHDMMIRRGAACLILCDALESSGYRVEIIAAHRSDSGENHYLYSIGIKRAEETLDIARLAYVLCHAAMFRRHTWRHLASVPGVRERYAGGHGAGTRDPEESYIEEIMPDVYLSDTDLHQYFSDTHSARQWIREQYERFKP